MLLGNTSSGFSFRKVEFVLLYKIIKENHLNSKFLKPSLLSGENNACLMPGECYQDQMD